MINLKYGTYKMVKYLNLENANIYKYVEKKF